MRNSIFYLVVIALIGFVGLIGCQEKGPAEKAGERVDEVVDNVAEGDPPLKEKGPMEEMGESIDEAAEDVNREDDNKE